MHQPPTQKFLPLFSRTCVFNPFRTSPYHARHPIPLPRQDKPTALWFSDALEPPVPGDLSEYIFWTCLTSRDTGKPQKVSIPTLPKTIRWNDFPGEYQHQYQMPIIRCCSCSNMPVSLFSAVQLLAHRPPDIPHRNHPLLLQQEKATDSRYSVLWDPSATNETTQYIFWTSQTERTGRIQETLLCSYPYLFDGLECVHLPSKFWNQLTSWLALPMQTGRSIRLIKEIQRSSSSSKGIPIYVVEARASIFFNCRLNHGTCSRPLLRYQCKMVAGFASTKMMYCVQLAPASLLLPWYS